MESWTPVLLVRIQLMLNYQQINLFGWTQISRTGGQLHSDTSPYKVSEYSLYQVNSQEHSFSCCAAGLWALQASRRDLEGDVQLFPQLHLATVSRLCRFGSAVAGPWRRGICTTRSSRWTLSTGSFPGTGWRRRRKEIGRATFDRRRAVSRKR